MKLKAIFAAALAAAVMTATTAMTVSAVDATTENVIDYNDGTVYYVWEALEIKADQKTVSVHLYDDADSRYRITDPIVIPETINGVTVTEIVGYGFAESNIPSLTIPRTVTTIGNDFVALCPKLTDIYFEGSEAQWNAINGGSGVNLSSSIVVHFGSESSGDTSPDGDTSDSDSNSETESSVSDSSVSAPDKDTSGGDSSVSKPDKDTSSSKSSDKEDNTKDEKSNGGVIAALVVGVVVVAGAAAVVVVRRKKK